MVDYSRIGWKVQELRERVGVYRDEYRSTFIEKPGGYRVRIRQFVGRVEQDLVDFRF